MHKETAFFQYQQPSPQSDLYTYLKSWQKKEVTSILKALRPRYQQMVCLVLLDYMETSVLTMTGEYAVDIVTMLLTMNPGQGIKPTITPLCSEIAESNSLLGINISHINHNNK